jgi:hypothetical protein
VDRAAFKSSAEDTHGERRRKETLAYRFIRATVSMPPQGHVLIGINLVRTHLAIGTPIGGIFRDCLKIGNALIELLVRTAHHYATSILQVEPEKNIQSVTANPIAFQAGDVPHVWWQVHHE